MLWNDVCRSGDLWMEISFEQLEIEDVFEECEPSEGFSVVGDAVRRLW